MSGEMAITFRHQIGRRLKEVRESRGITQAELAKISGVTAANIGKIEQGRYNVSVDILGKIVHQLGAKIDITD